MYVVRAPALDFQSPRTTNSLPASPLGCVTHPTSNDKICRATVLPFRCSFLCSSQLAGTTSYLLSAMLAPNTASTGLPCSASDPAVALKSYERGREGRGRQLVTVCGGGHQLGVQTQ